MPDGLRSPDSPAGWMEVTSDDAVHLIHDRMVEAPPVVPTGLPEIDEAMWLWGDRRGIPLGSYVIVGGASNVGKTQYGLALLRQAARCGEKAAMVCMDMRPRDALVRVHQAVTVDKIPFTDWIPSRWKPEYEQVLKDALLSFRLSCEGSIAIHDGGSKSLGDVCRIIEDGVRVGATFFVVDHLQNIRVQGMGDDNISDRAQIVSEAMVRIAKEHDVTVVALSQLNRFASSNRDRQPCMQDLWGGTAMESNATLVIILDHTRYERDDELHHIGRTYVLLDKNQIGPKGFDVAVEWNHATLEIREAKPDEIDSWPAR